MGAHDAPPLTRGHKKRARTRRQLIESGLAVLAAKGEALTVTDVVAAAGVSNGTFYNYFDDRDELFDALARHLAATAVDEADRTISSEDAAVRFAIVTARVLARAAADPTWGQVVLRLENLRVASHDHPVRHLRADLDRGRRQGRFAVGADESTVDLVGGVVMMAIRRIVTGTASRDYVVAAITGALCALGVERSEADVLAASGADDAGW